MGELEYENFNAGAISIDIQGRNVHPGFAKDKMLNSFSVAMELDSMLPQRERPEYTAGYEGFYHLMSMSGSVDYSNMQYIVRDHSDEIYLSRMAKFDEIAEVLNQKYGAGTVTIHAKEQYRNMRSVIENGNMGVVDHAVAAMERCGVTPDIKPIRGGTDGSRLSFMNLPTPNIFAGGENFHGRHEYVSIEVMNKAVEVAIEICKA